MYPQVVQLDTRRLQVADELQLIRERGREGLEPPPRSTASDSALPRTVRIAYLCRGKHRIAAVLTVIGVLLILGASAQATTSKPEGMSNPAYRALMLRSEALNETYSLGIISTASQGTDASAFRALTLRSEALNRKYHLGAFAPATRVVSETSDFSWSAFGIGAAAMLGLALFASGAVVGTRHGWRTPRTRISS